MAIDANYAEHIKKCVSPPKIYRVGSSRVIEYNYALPKGKHRNLLGSFTYSPPSRKASALRAEIKAAKRRLQQMQSEMRATGSDYKKKQSLQCHIKYLEHMLSAEVASQDTIRINVRELDD